MLCGGRGLRLRRSGIENVGWKVVFLGWMGTMFFVQCQFNLAFVFLDVVVGDPEASD